MVSLGNVSTSVHHAPLISPHDPSQLRGFSAQEGGLLGLPLCASNEDLPIPLLLSLGDPPDCPSLRASSDPHILNDPSKLARFLSGMGADGSSTARVQRGPSEAARCASTEDHQAPSPPFHRARSASKKDGLAVPHPP